MRGLIILWRYITLPYALFVYYFHKWKLNRILLKIAGNRTVIRDWEWDVRKLTRKGQLFDCPVQFTNGLFSECHFNSALLLNRGDVDAIATGYVLNGGIWRQHSWGIQYKNGAATIIETTIEREAYYGFILNKEEAYKFMENELKADKLGRFQIQEMLQEEN